MKNCRTIFFSVIIALLITQVAFSQDNTINDKNTPFQLLSSYYNDGNFSPFRKKNGYVGLAFSLNDHKRANTTNLLANVIEGHSLSYSIDFKGGYYTGEYNMIGLNFTYYQNGFTGTTFQDPDTVNTNSLQRGFNIAPNLRTSIPLTKNQRLSLFVAVGLNFGMSNTLTRNTSNIDNVTKNYSTEYDFGAGINPGVTFFAMEAFAFEVGLTILSYNINMVDSQEGVEIQSRDVNQNISLDIDLLTLKLGLAYYIGANK